MPDSASLAMKSSDPENGSEMNIAFERFLQPDGAWAVREISVDESYARKHPVWVINRNDDAGFVTPQMAEKLGMLARPSVSTRSYGAFKTLVLKEFKAHRNYDGWFSGGSEFFVKCGAIESFKARTDEEMGLTNINC